MEISNLLAEARLAVPGLEWFGELNPDGAVVAAQLEGLTLDGLGHPIVDEAEVELGRWIGLGACMVMVTEDGTPVAVSGASKGQLVPAVSSGGISLVLTERRLVGSFLMGELGGSVRFRDGQALAMSYPFDLVDAVTVQSSRSMFGKQKETSILVQTLGSPAVGVLRIDPDASLSYPSLDGQRRVDVGTVAQQIVEAVARRRGLEIPPFDIEDGDRVASFPERDTAAS